jgi:colicin import membrane protein
MELTYEATATETSAPDVVELALIGKPNALALFQPNGLDQILDKIRDEVSRHVPDISTERGRKAISSLARKVASSKVRLDDLGKELVCEVKAQVGQIDAERKRMRDELDQLRDDTRRPLTEWEDAEKSRVQAHEDAVAEMTNMVPADTIDAIAAQMKRVEEYVARNPQEFKERYGRASLGCLSRLSAASQAIRVRQEEQAELARLQKLEAERLQLEREERIKAQAAAEAKAAAEARALEEAAAVERAAKAEHERIQREKDEAEDRAKRAEAARVEAIEAARIEEEAAAKAKAQAEATALAAAKAAEAEADRKARELAAEAKRQQAAADNARREAEERTRKAEEAAVKAARDAELAIVRERERVAEEKRVEAKAATKREANKKHRAGINRAAVAALVASAGLTNEAAVLVVTAIAHGKVPNVSISY